MPLPVNGTALAQAAQMMPLGLERVVEQVGSPAVLIRSLVANGAECGSLVAARLGELSADAKVLMGGLAGAVVTDANAQLHTVQQLFAAGPNVAVVGTVAVAAAALGFAAGVATGARRKRGAERAAGGDAHRVRETEARHEPEPEPEPAPVSEPLWRADVDGVAADGVEEEEQIAEAASNGEPLTQSAPATPTSFATDADSPSSPRTVATVTLAVAVAKPRGTTESAAVAAENAATSPTANRATPRPRDMHVTQAPVETIDLTCSQ